MFDDTFRKIKDQLFAPIALRLNINPNLITVLALIVALLTGWLALQHHYILAFFGWGLSRVLDALDGSVARLNDQQSDFGGYLDIVLDHVAYVAIPIGLVLGLPSELNYLSLVFLLSSYYINAASWMYLSSLLEKRAQGAKAKGEVTSVVMPGGLVAGTETVFFYCLFILFNQWLATLFVIFGAMVLITVIQRLVWAVQNL